MKKRNKIYTVNVKTFRKIMIYCSLISNQINHLIINLHGKKQKSQDVVSYGYTL